MVLQIEEETTVSIIVRLVISSRICFKEVCPAAPLSLISAISGQEGIPVIEIDRSCCLFYRFGSPVVIVETEILLLNIDNFITVTVESIGIPNEIEGNILSVSPDTVTLVAGCYAVAETINFIILDCRSMNFSPPTFIESYNGWLIGNRIEQVFPLYPQH